MSKAQKTCLMIGLLLIVLAALFPPTCYVRNTKIVYSRGFLYYGNLSGMHFERLVIEWVFLAAITAFFMVLDKPIGKICTWWVYECRHAIDIEKDKTEHVAEDSGHSGFPPARE